MRYPTRVIQIESRSVEAKDLRLLFTILMEEEDRVRNIFGPVLFRPTEAAL
jgi:hypothetical protein